ncbi:hypothetical protein [Ornithinibacillus halophilus]|uniref:Uncharacterized protein n=1 Tax=Ornithinibacillus halophilus TaxID=930117 RepID=A0A1M5IH56_9BACI|nr:hypothetical protein [Ornithinibacillus halophilus]SHG27668.1 hypothetical protein SAMN05216225_102415 [Ornithinibacillus halophilus]
MNDKDRDYGMKNPHFDGPRESIINDNEGQQFGMQMDKKLKQSPYPVKELKEDPEMNTFDQTFGNE